MLTLTVRGADEVASGIATLERQVDDLTPAMAEVGEAMLDAARPVTPVLTGRLVRSLVADPGRSTMMIRSELVYAGVQDRRFGITEAADAVGERVTSELVERLLSDTARRAGLV